MTEIHNFLGLTGYYRRFVKDFSKFFAPLTRLTCKNVKYLCDNACEENFARLKECLTKAPVLVLPSESGGFTVYSDASRVGLGRVLMQHGRIVVMHRDNSRSMSRTTPPIIWRWRSWCLP